MWASVSSGPMFRPLSAEAYSKGVGARPFPKAVGRFTRRRMPRLFDESFFHVEMRRKVFVAALFVYSTEILLLIFQIKQMENSI